MASGAGEAPGMRTRRAILFVLIGLFLYLCLYAGSEALVYHFGQRNRFFMIRTAPLRQYDYVIVGASHAMPFDFEDMNRRLEEASGTHLINLSIEGGGVLPARLAVDYFLAGHTTRNVLYFLDSFAFQSAQWNEARLADASAFARAPFDPALVATLWRYPWARPNLPDYVSGFSKINNPGRFAPDVTEAEAKNFHNVYRPIAYLDRQRIQYLYAARPDPATVQRYRDAFTDFAGFLRERGIRLIVVRPPIPARIARLIPGEAEFGTEIADMARRLDIELRDFSGEVTKDSLYYNSDHLNRDGVLEFSATHLVPLLVQYRE
jgi:hypothetical protein